MGDQLCSGRIVESCLTLGSEGILVMFFSRTYLGTLVDRATRLLGQLIIAPVSDVREEDTL